LTESNITTEEYIFDLQENARRKAQKAEDRRKLKENNKATTETLKIDTDKFKLPYYEWTIKFRKIIEGHQNILEFLPMWEPIYRDAHPFLMLAIGRQLGKTTYGGGRLAYVGTQEHTKGVYVTFEDESLRSFSNDKFRGSILHADNPELFEIVKGADSGKGAVSRVEYLTNSSTSLVTDAGGMHHVEGKSANFVFYDEDQNLDLSEYEKSAESQAWTQGDELFAGIGGYLGTAHHNLWLSTDQREWIFEDEYWREKLKFGPRGLIWDDGTGYLKDVLRGRWEPKAPKNYARHGYHLSQMMFPNIPLTIKDAEQKYHTHERFSIEYKRSHYPASFFARNVEALFVKGETRPFTRESMLRLFDRGSFFTKPDQVDHSDGKVYAAADWGGGSSAFTVPMIAQCYNPKNPIFKILYIERMDEPDVERQADRFINLCNAYEVDKIAIDAGGGPRQAQKVETTFADRCKKISYITRPDMPLPRESELDTLDKENRFIIDRTYSFDVLKDKIDNPLLQGENAFPRFIIPAGDLEKVSWIIDHFIAVEGEIVKLKSTGQDYIRYTHNPATPDDAVHSFNYTWIAQLIDQGTDIWIKSF
jgi:hypothetical protein